MRDSDWSREILLRSDFFGGTHNSPNALIPPPPPPPPRPNVPKGEITVSRSVFTVYEMT